MNAARVRRFRIGIGIGFAMLLAMPYPVAAASSAAPVASHRQVPVGGVASTTSWIVTLQPGADVAKTAAPLARAVGGGSGMIFRYALHGFVFRGSAKAAGALFKNPNVRSVVANQKIAIAADTIPTGVSRIRADHATKDSAYGMGFTGKGVKVAILDTGIDLTHPDLVPNLNIALGRNCITTGPPQDGHGHGTHVAGIVAAAANGIGVIGVAPEATLVPIKVLDDTGQGQWSNLICAVDYLTGLITDSDPTNDVRVANMSLGDVGSIGSCTDGGIREAICHSVAAGVTYIAAAGNSTVDTSTFIPAAFPEVIAVSALTDLDGEPGGKGGCWLFYFYCDDTLAEFSNFGATVAVTAPGTNIYSDWTGGGYATESGTSMASPHVAGVAALMIAANKNLTPADVRGYLKSSGECPNGVLADADGSGTCTGKGQWGNDPDGIAEPLVNALNAVLDVSGTPGDHRPIIHITSPADGATVSAPVTVTATATDDIGVTKVDFFVDGVLTATDTNGADGYSMTWSPNVDGASYTIKATATDTSGQTSSAFATVSTSPGVQGSWVGTYGQDGYILGNWNGDGSTDLASLPTGVTYALELGARATWVSPTSDVRALTNPAGTERRSQTFYATDKLRVRLSFANAYSGTLHLYAVDWDAYGGNRYENITVDDGSGPRVAHLSSSFVPGAWVHAPITVAAGGSVTVTVDRTAGNSAVLAGLFLGGASAPPPPPPTLPVDSPGVQGSWVGTYGQDGYILGNWNGDGSTDLASLPTGVTYALELGARATWVSPTSDVRALTNPAGTERRSQTFYATDKLRVRLSFANAYSGTLHLYAVDWDAYGGNRYENITVDDGSGPRVAHLSSSFVPGAWVHAPITVAAGGSVTVTVDRTAGNSAVLAGLFLGGASAPPPPPPTLPVDSPGVQGSWVGTYGQDGYILGNWNGDGSTDLASLPTGVTYALELGARATWVSPTSDVRALTNPAGTERRSQTFYATDKLRVRLSFANAYSGTLHLYAVDWDAYGGNRYENITVDDGSGPRVAHLSSSFVPGAWVHAPITVAAGGSVTVTVDRTAGNSAVLAGLFLGGASAPPPPPPTLPVDSPGVQGSWVGTYGQDGYILGNWNGDGSTDLASLPTGVTYALELGARATWVSPTSDVRALTNPAGTERRSQTFYATDKLRVRLSFANAYSGTLHLYAVDWDAYGGNRYENITVDDGSGPRVAHLSSSFVPGAWVHAPITVAAGGSVTVTVDRTAGNSAVLAGLFLGGASAPPPTAPGAPTGLTATPGNAQVALAWTAPASNGGSAITGYTATASPGGATCTTATLGCTVSGLTNGTAYTFTVKASNAVGPGPASAPASATPVVPPTAPGAPTGLTATPGNAQVALAWTAPASNGGSAITAYTATASPGGATCTTATLGCTVAGLTNGTAYTFTVIASNAVGPGPASAPTSATPVAPPTAPGAPTGLTATPGNAQVALAWTAPASNGGSAITGYTATASPGGATCTTATLGCTVSGLTNGTAYTFTVKASNAVGPGPASAPASATPRTVPTAPRNLAAAASATKGVNLTWTAPSSNGGSAVTGYRIYRSTSTGTETFLIAVGNVTSYIDTATTAGVRYFYKITAVNVAGEGPRSAEANARAK